MTISERLDIFMKFKGLNDNQITVQAGLSVGQIARIRINNKGLNSYTIEKILNRYPELSVEWLITGKGEMLRDGVASGYNESGTQQIIQGNNNRNNSVTVGPQTVAELQKAIEEKDNTIRLQAETIARLSQIIGK